MIYGSFIGIVTRLHCGVSIHFSLMDSAPICLERVRAMHWHPAPQPFTLLGKQPRPAGHHMVSSLNHHKEGVPLRDVSFSKEERGSLMERVWEKLNAGERKASSASFCMLGTVVYRSTRAHMSLDPSVLKW